METVLDRDLSGSDVGNHLRNEEGVELRAVLLVDGIVASFLLKGVNTTDTYTEHHADAVLVDSFEVPAAVLDSLHGSHESVLLVKVHFASLLAVDKVGSLKALHLACKLCFELRRIEVCDRAGAANAVLDVFPSFGYCVTYWCEGAKACYNNSFEFHKV